MQNPRQKKWWSRYAVGVGIGALSWFVFATADQPVGITTGCEDTVAIVQLAAAAETAQDVPLFGAALKR